MFHKFLMPAGIGLTVAGAVFGVMLWQSHGILAEIGGAILGGIAGLFIGLSVIYGIEVIAVEVWKIIRRNPAQKKSGNSITKNDHSSR